MIAWLLAIAVGVVLVLWFRHSSRRRAFRKRRRAEIAHLYRAYLHHDSVSFETFKEVLEALGRSFRVDPGLLRPEDPLDVLRQIDSWDLDDGTEQMETWLRQRLGVSVPDRQLVTVDDLMLIVEHAQPGKS